tara:strand:+ start:1459 stop:1830 length:372 start_codon:yes stop_codon:yes gene_type:complete
MKAILIDPFDESVSEVEYNGDYKEIYNLADCRTFDVVSLDDTNDVYVDDEGLLKNPTRYFRIFSYNTMRLVTLAGKGLILGHNDDGETIATTLNANEYAETIQFLPEGYSHDPVLEFTAANWS